MMIPTDHTLAETELTSMSFEKAIKDGLSLTAYLGDRAVLLAFNIEEEKRTG
jgi:hypothetical protein